MSHNIDFSTGRAAMAFIGSRNDIWHRHGQEMRPGMSTAEWAVAAGLDWKAVKVPALAALTGPEFDHIDPAKRFAEVAGRKHIVRSDNGHPLGYVSDLYQPVQPADVLAWFEQYISVDERFQLDVAGSLKKGEIIWATATFRDSLKVGGDEHKARLLMTTTFDGSGATINKGTMTRVVCNNTLDAALGSEKNTVVRTRHSTKFDGKRVGDELAVIAKGFSHYAAMGDAMAGVHMAAADVSNFFKAILDIPFDAKESDLSTRKLNQFNAIKDSYKTTCRETEQLTAWAALNAITRYVDHSPVFSTKDASDERRFLSTQFGGGSDIKAKAVDLLMPLVKDKVAIAA
jgi:phage/plasmid-like protein (TIGR03299 family)